jgi:hypothetical protein
MEADWLDTVLSSDTGKPFPILATAGLRRVSKDTCAFHPVRDDLDAAIEKIGPQPYLGHTLLGNGFRMPARHCAQGRATAFARQVVDRSF